jgi:peptidoglycan hydrolase-like protein with peptidoglycan-binding domain
MHLTSTTGPDATRRGRRALALVAAGGLLVALSGCSDDPEQTAVAIAQANVSAKEQSLADAESEAAAAAEAFCAASSTYITAVDRYGDVLTQTAPTVGDVRDAGADLDEPREETLEAGEAVADAREVVATAQQDLAEAQAALAAAEAEAAGEQAPTEPAPSVEPSAPPAELTAAVDRVTQAEADFAEMQEGITDTTPLQQASVQFNSAAVALQMAWLQLFAQAGCLSDAQQEQAAAAVAEYTEALQQSLTDAGYFDGEVDGVYGPETVEAVQALQKANGLPQTGWVDKATDAALQAELTAAGGAAAQQSTASTAAVQQTLKLAGYWDGPVDGQWSDELTEALEEFQTDLGVPATGTVDAATIAAFNEALANAQQPPSASASASPEPSEEPSEAEPSEEASASAGA